MFGGSGADLTLMQAGSYDITMSGVDEQTAVVRSREGTWQVLGKGRAVIIDPDLRQQVYLDGAQFALSRVSA
jgi:cyanophycinase-like exopeptidase